MLVPGRPGKCRAVTVTARADEPQRWSNLALSLPLLLYLYHTPGEGWSTSLPARLLSVTPTGVGEGHGLNRTQ